MSGPPPNYPGDPSRLTYLPQTSSHGSAQSVLSPTTSTTGLPGVSMLRGSPATLLNQPESNMPRLPYPTQIPPIGEGQQRYVSDYDPAHQEPLIMRGVLPAGSQLSPLGPPVPGQKRAYRQRRKDPSCDACRERKVKCDATETSSCSECTSRNVKCQFTKETNRRMSSIKQVQDLERQLLEARQQVTSLQSQLQTGTGLRVITGPSSESRPLKRRRVESFQDYAKISSNLRRYGQGIFQTFPESTDPVTLDPPADGAELPPRHLADELLSDYDALTHLHFSCVKTEPYRESLDEIYQRWSVNRSKDESAAILLGIFAIGGLRRYRNEAEKSLRILLFLLNGTSQTSRIDLLCASILACIALIELNKKSAAYRRLGLAVRGAQELGLNLPASARVDRNEQKCIAWCTLYCTEVLLAVELGLPTMFAADDHERMLQWTDEFLSDAKFERLRTAVVCTKSNIEISRYLRTTENNDANLANIDEHLDQYMAMLPPSLHPESKESTTLSDILPFFYLQDMRLLSYRHQINPAYPTEMRARAVDDCLTVIENTLISLDKLRTSSGSFTTGTNDSLAGDTTTFFCLHIWRCFLFLVARANYDAAKVCAEIGIAIGSSRPVNESCGRYAEFFLTWIVLRRQNQLSFLEDDEEVYAYLSADMQGNLDQAWVWQEDGENQSPTKDSGSGDVNVPLARDNAWNRNLEKLQASIESAPRSLPRLAPISQADQRSATGQQTSPSTRISIADII